MCLRDVYLFVSEKPENKPRYASICDSPDDRMFISLNKLFLFRKQFDVTARKIGNMNFSKPNRGSVLKRTLHIKDSKVSTIFFYKNI